MENKWQIILPNGEKCLLLESKSKTVDNNDKKTFKKQL
jgi:hypothetical protein